MVTDDQYRRWLQQSSGIQRVLLAELTHSDGIEYVSSSPYITHPSDSLPNQPYNDLLTGAFDVSSRIDSLLSYGDIVLVDDGSLADWADRYWRGYPVVLKMGSPDWSYDDFRVIARQTNGGVQRSDDRELVMGIYDPAAQLDQPLSQGRPDIDGKSVPLILGDVFGARADRIDTQTLAYRVSWLPVSGLVSRDGNGPVMSHVGDYSNGQFTLSAYTPRSVLCEVQESHNTAALIIQWVADYYSLSVASLSLPDYRLGLRYEGEVSGRQVLDDVCAAIGANWSINLAGELQVRLLELPGSAELDIYPDDVVQGKIQLIRTEEPWKKLDLKYARNYTPLSEVAGSVNDDDPALAERLRQEWRVQSQSQSLSAYPLAPEEIRETCLVNSVDAIAEAARRMVIRSERREVWELECFLVWSGDLVGRSVAVHHPRLAGRLGRIISARLSPMQERVTLEIWY